MYIALNKDGTYRQYKNIEKIYKDSHDVKYIIIENSTDLKGELYTIIDALNIKIERGDINVEIDVSYDCADCPCSDETSFKSNINIDNIERYYSIYPLLKQMMVYNYFIDDFMYEGPVININTVRLISDNFKVIIDNKTSDEDINKIFKKLNMDTCVSKVTRHTRFLILKDNMWFVSRDVPKHFDYIGVEVIGAESMYILSEEYYRLFDSILTLSISMKDKSIYANGYYSDLLADRGGNEFLTVEFTTLSGILQLCVYFPQMLLLDRQIYNNSISLEINVETKMINYNLVITEKEVRGGICLFDILKKLLKM